MKKFGNCNNSSTGCPKGGVKIRETYTNTNTNNNSSLDPEQFYNQLKNQNKHTGVRMTQGENEYSADPFDNINPFSNPDGIKDFKNVTYDNSSYSQMDLNIDNYSINDIYKLFGVQNKILTDDVMRESKKIVLDVIDNKPGAASDIVCLNAGATLYVAGVAQDIASGVQMAKAAITSGAARKKLDAFIAATQAK